MMGPLVEVDDDSGNLGLFDHFCVEFPEASRPSIFLHAERVIGVFPRLAWSRPAAELVTEEQLELKLEMDASVVDFVTPRQRNYLGYAIRDLARRSPELRGAVTLLSRRNIHFVGDLLSRERGYLVYVVGLDYAEIALFDALLAQVGLRTSMSMPYWTPPFEKTA